MNITASRLRKSLSRYAFALACVVVIAAGIALTALDHQISFRRILSTIGINLIASVVFAIAFALISSRIQERVLQANLDEHFKDLSSQLTGQFSVVNSQYVPARTYEASNTLGNDFNKDLTASLHSTGLYVFRGTSAKYVAARVKASTRQLQELKVITLDPGSERALRRRAVDRQRTPDNRDKSVEDLVSEMQEEILMSMVALFDCRQICSIELTYAVETAVTRAELFDDAVYISWYHGPLSTSHTFPEAFKFNAGSFPYEIQRREMFRRFELADKKFTFESGQREEELTNYLSRAAGRSITRSDVIRWRRAYDDFSAPFVARVERL